MIQNGEPASERRDMKNRIHDIELIEDRLTIENAEKEHVAYNLAEALNDAYSSEMDRKDDARNFENDTLGYWETLIAESVQFWPRKETPTT